MSPKGENAPSTDDKSPRPGWFTRLYRRCKAYFLERFVPVGFLWAVIGIASKWVPAIVMYFSEEPLALKDIPLKPFLDPKLIAILFFGLVCLAGVFEVAVKFTGETHFTAANKREFFDRVWDEISGAATHLGCGLASLWAFGSHAPLVPYVTGAWIALGVVAFRAPLSASLKKEQPDVPA
jgi:hypothetical protein